jgi:hypothetical protein
MCLWHQKGGALALVIVLALVMVIDRTAAAQDAPDLSTVRDAFVQGDAKMLLDAAGDRVEIALMGQGQLYSRAQATYVMQDFFREHPPVQFSLEPGYGDEGSWIVAGEYWYRQEDASLQVYLRLRLKDKQWEVREIRIEPRR